jgi:hypothetical protein
MSSLKEGIDYELIPAKDSDNDQAWDIRILEGDYVETVIRFGNIKLDGESGCLNFNFVIQSTPNNNLDESDVDFQNYVADILENILIEAAKHDSIQLGKPN